MAPIAIHSQAVEAETPVVKKLQNTHLATATTPLTTTTTTASSVFHHSTPRPTAISGHGIYYDLADGRRVIDGVSGGALVSSLGNGIPELIQTMVDAANRMAFCYHQSLGNSEADKLAAYLCSKSGGRFVAGAFLNSGSEAVEACLKTARQYWVMKGQPQRKYIIARSPSYHGNTLGALTAGYSPLRRDIFDPILGDFVHRVSSPTYKRSHREGETEEMYSARLAQELDDKINELGAENIMGFMAEPVTGASTGGMPPPKGYFPAMNAVVQKHGLLFIMDEVMSGSGRCGEIFAFDAVGEGVSPDLLSMAKGLGSGYVTISAMMSSEKVHSVLSGGKGPWQNSHTYQNHPINCAVALNVLQIMERENLMQNVRERGAQLIAELKEALQGEEVVFDVRGKGLFIGVEYGVSSKLVPRFSERVKAKAFDHGLLTLGTAGVINGVDGDATILGPAYNVTAAQVTEIVERLAKAVKDCAAEL